MNTFLWIHDYQWNAISSIATAVGVILALFIPVYARLSEKRKLLHYHVRAMRKLIRDFSLFYNAYNENSKTKEWAHFCAKEFSTFEVIDIQELVKYDSRLFDVFDAVRDAIIETQHTAKEYLRATGTENEEFNRMNFDRLLEFCNEVISTNREYLVKKKVMFSLKKI